MTTDAFDASEVDLSTIRFGATGSEAAPVHIAAEDVDGDGRVDLLLHFDRQQTGIACGASFAMLKARTADGEAIEGVNGFTTTGCPPAP